MFFKNTLKLDQYIDIDLIIDFDDYEKSSFACDVEFKVVVDNTGLFYDVHKISNLKLNYTEIKNDIYTPIMTDLNDFNITYKIIRSDNTTQSVKLDSVEVDLIKKTVVVVFSN